MIRAFDFDERAELNRSLLVRCAELGLLGLTVPEADGGAGMDATAADIVAIGEGHQIFKMRRGHCFFPIPELKWRTKAGKITNLGSFDALKS